MNWIGVGKFIKDNFQYIIGAIAAAFILWFVWSWFELRKERDAWKDAADAKDAVVEITDNRRVREEEINNEADERINDLEQNTKEPNAPMSPAVRAAIDSLY